MKRTIVTTLCSILIVFSFSGCSTKCPEPTIVNVPQKCVIPVVEEPAIDNDKHTSNEDIVTKALFNYIEMKKYAQKLLAAQEVCK